MKRDLDKVEIAHLQRIENALFHSYDLSGVVRYLEDKTFLKGDRFSFKDHEFQETILTDTSKEVNVQKCAQVGMSEAMARYALAVCRVMPYFSVILTMPFKDDAANFAKTRLDPIITETPDLRDSMDKDLDNSEVKGIENSLLYMRGCSGTTAALSVPADMLIHDELDRSDEDIVGQYQSRIKHSKHKLTRKFGTPTLEGRGIAKAMETSLRHRMACICNHCDHKFIPSFHTHVKIPGYNDGTAENGQIGELSDINKYNIHKIQWERAHLECPMCHQEPSLQMEHREWICENPSDNYTAIGYYVTPFEVPNVVSIPSLVMEITKYKTWGEFVNQALGETISGNASQLTAADVNKARFPGSLMSNELHNMGIDVGQICHVTIGRRTRDDVLLVVHRERVKLDELKMRKVALKRKYRVIITVIDAFPETNLVHQMQKADKNLYGAQYHESRKTATYEIVMADAVPKEGKVPLNVVKISRNIAFDEVMFRYKEGRLQWAEQRDAEDDIYAQHATDMKREQTYVTKTQEMIWAWTKSKEAQDHYHHSICYLHVACALQPTVSKNMSFGSVPLALRMKVTEKSESQVFDAVA